MHGFRVKSMSFSSIEFSSVLEFDRSCVFLEFRRIESLWIYLGLKITLNIWKNFKNTITLFISISGKMLFVNLRYYCVYRLARYRANCTTKLVQLDRPITKSNNKFDNTIANTYISIYIGLWDGNWFNYVSYFCSNLLEHL